MTLSCPSFVSSSVFVCVSAYVFVYLSACTRRPICEGCRLRESDHLQGQSTVDMVSSVDILAACRRRSMLRALYTPRQISSDCPALAILIIIVYGRSQASFI